MRSGRAWLTWGAALGALGVALGAFGAHALEGHLADTLAASEAARALQTWEVAVRYQMYHALALLVTGLWANAHPRRALTIAGWAFVLGVAIFSGCLYVLVLTGLKLLGAIVPIGGVLLILGWLALLGGSITPND